VAPWVSDIAARASGIGIAARAACICPAESQRQVSVKVPSSSRIRRVWDRPVWAARIAAITAARRASSSGTSASSTV
jgi:hypothetical protein